MRRGSLDNPRVYTQLTRTIVPGAEAELPLRLRQIVKPQLAGLSAQRRALSFAADEETCSAIAAWLKGQGATVRLLRIEVGGGPPNWARPSEQWVGGLVGTEAFVAPRVAWKEHPPPHPPGRIVEVPKMPAADLVEVGFDLIASTRLMEFMKLPPSGGVTQDGWHRLWPGGPEELSSVELLDPVNLAPSVRCTACARPLRPLPGALIARPGLSLEARVARDPLELEHPGTCANLLLRVKTATTLLSKFPRREGSRIFFDPVYAWDSPVGETVRTVRRTFADLLVGDALD